MKVIIWIKEEDVLSNKITTWHVTKPKSQGNEYRKWVRVVISRHKFITLLDNPLRDDVSDMLNISPDEMDIL